MADLFGDPAAANSGFADLLDDPRARAALLQIGLNLMQPSYGQTPLGHIAGAIGSGGEAIGRVEEQDRKTRETDSKIDKREADLSTMQGRLDAAAQQNTIRQQRADSEQAAREGRISLGQSRLELDKARETERQRQFGLTQAFRETDKQGKILSSDAAAIERKLKEEAKREADFKIMARSGETFQGDPSLAPYKGLRTRTEIEAALSNDPAYLSSVLTRHGTPSAQSGDTMTVPNTPRPISGTRDDSGAITNFPEAPRNPGMRSAGQVYQTPQGPLEWTGAGWRAPQGI